MLDHLEKKEYQQAMEIADGIDWRRVKNASMLNTVSEIYEYNGEFKKGRDILFLAFDRAPGSRKIVYRLGTLALKIKDIREATDCYEEFVRLAPKDPNQYILKYKILRTQGAALSDQITALEEFKKAEYIEKWAYELAKLYDEAGMTAECLEECDDLILWFSEGKYVYLAMELKMKYKPLTPLQQEKYDSRPGAVKKKPEPVKQPESTLEEVDDENEYDEGADTDVETQNEPVPSETVERISETEVQEIPPQQVPMQEELLQEEPVQEEVVQEVPEEEVTEEPEVENVTEEASIYTEQKPAEHASAIKQVVTGATLEEALAQGMAVASGINIEEEAMKEREDEILANGQMMIDDILQKWEAKQKDHEEAIAKQKAKDEERLQKEREQARIRQEEERREVERKAAEAEARRKAEEEAARKAAGEEARRKAEEEAARKAAEEEARRKAEEEAVKKAEEEAARKAVEEIEKKAAEQRELSEEKTQRIPDDIVRLMEEMENENEASAEEIYEEDFEDGPEMEEDFIDGIEEELSGMDMSGSSFEEADFEEADFEDEDFEEADFEEEDFEDEDFEEADFEEDFEDEDFEEADFEEEDFEDEDFEEADFEEADFEDEDFEETELEENPEADSEDEDFEEADFEEDFGDEDFEEADFEEDFDEADDEDFSDFEEADFEEADFEDEDFEEADFEEDFEDEEIGEPDFEDVDDEETDFDDGSFEEDFEEDFDEADDEDFSDFEDEDFEEEELEIEDDEEEDLEIEEPSEEEIQARIKKSKGGGVPFDTGFVVTGRYDLSATSEIGLKAGLTEEQKKLFSYFVPVRGMSEQIVEALDNDRRAQREGTSKTGNLLIVGRKGSGKTVLAVDIVKAIQKQRNLKQGKVAIVTGESLNKKELTNIIQKLRGGAIIIERAGKLNSRTVKELNYLMEKKTGELLFVLEDQKKPLERLMTANPEFKKKFSSKLELPVFINDELVTFGQTYAKENGYKLDEMGILALYSRIDVMQREDHAVSVAEVKEIMDEAISHSQKANVKHLARRVFGKGTDDSDRIILKEEDFKI